jgi:hypothetical protein
MKRIMACFFVLVSSVQVAEAHFSCNNDFGKNVQIITEQMRQKWGKLYKADLNGDFNGDGIQDQIIILKLDRATRFKKGVVLLNPAIFDLKVEKSSNKKMVLPEKPSVALGIVHSNNGNDCQKFVIYNPEYFPVYEKARLLVKVIHAGDRGHEQYNDYDLATERIKHDLIYLDAERSAIIYWNGKEFKLELPYADPSQLEDADPPEPE